jgi:hypothetical protein
MTTFLQSSIEGAKCSEQVTAVICHSRGSERTAQPTPFKDRSRTANEMGEVQGEEGEIAVINRMPRTVRRIPPEVITPVIVQLAPKQ